MGAAHARTNRSRDERGAVAPLVAIVLVLLIAVSSFAVDLGLQRVARRDMQALVDIVAMDLARRLDGRTAGALTTAMASAQEASVTRNATTTVGADPVVTHELGVLATDGTFTPVGSGAVPNAVRVTARTEVDYAFRAGAGATSRSAVAMAESKACFTVGSYAATITSDESPLLQPLLGILGAELNLSLADARGLANVDLPLLGFIDAGLGVGTLEELVALRGVKLGDFYLAMADVLRREVGNTAQVLLLEALAVRVPGLDLDLADILAIDTGGDAGLGGRVNVFDLVTTGLFAANGTNGVTIPELAIGVPGLLQLTGSVKLIQKPNVGCGRARPAADNPNTVAHSNQLEIRLGGRGLDLNIGIARLAAKVEVLVELAPADAVLKDVTCRPGHDTIVVSVGDSLLTLTVRLDVLLSAIADLITIAEGGIDLRASRYGPMKDLVIDVYNGDYSVPGTSGGGSIGLPELDVDASRLKLLGLPVGEGPNYVLKPLLRYLVNPLLQGLDHYLLSPLLEFLGIQISGAEIYALPKAVCGAPALRG